MKKRFSFLYFFNILLFLVSVGVTGYMIYLNHTTFDYFVLIPILFVVISLSLIIAFNLTRKSSEKESALFNRLGRWNSITYKVKKAGETAFNHLPIGIIIIDKDDNISWANAKSRDIFMSPLEKINLQDISKDLFDGIHKNPATDDGTISFGIKIYGEIYEILYLSDLDIIYLTKTTELTNLKALYDNRILAIGYMNIDNFEEALAGFDPQERAEYQGKLISMVANWAEQHGIFSRAFSDSRYMLIMDKEQLKMLQKENFDILDNTKIILRSTKLIRITLSIGVACCDIPISKLASLAQDQLDMALSRGGDQTVMKVDNKNYFYGAKTDPVPKESKVAIRNKSEELQDLIQKSSKVFILGHVNTDADCFGSMVAIYRLALAYDKETYIILDKDSIDDTVTKIYDTIRNQYVILNDSIILPSQVSKKKDENSLLMITDFQTEYQLSPNSTSIPKQFKDIGIIDHHRKGAGAFRNFSFYYCEAGASSSVELIMNLLEFSAIPLNFNDLEATWLLLGIVVDTNNFVYHTKQNTFIVASTLTKYGADMQRVKTYLKEDFSERRLRDDLIHNMETYRNVAIAFATDDKIYQRTELAKVADEMLTIDNIDFAVCIAYLSNNEVGLSARSLGVVNAQMVMERLGGGGHLNNAAAQIKDKTISEVIVQLKKVLDSLDKEENMKVILIQDVKDKGKKDQILEFSSGYANYLIKEKKAVLATPENVQTLEREKEEAQLRIQQHIKEMEKLKSVIESNPIKIQVRVGSDGKLFGSVSTKQIADELEKVCDAKLEKRKIELKQQIVGLGTYLATIELCKEVVATITIYIVENANH